MLAPHMKVTFGLHLDSRQGPLLESRFNAPVVGRLGLLGLLELHLGLAGPQVARSQRVAAYLGHLRRVDDGQRFYSRSLEADEMGVASKLLGWRDEWLLHGWNGNATADAPGRVLDMAATEAAARGRIPLGEAERLQQVHDTLESRDVAFGEVQLVDEWQRLPKAWRSVLTRLPVRNTCDAVPMAFDKSSTLGLLQEAALTSSDTGIVGAIENAHDDGSVVVYRGESVDTALHWLAARRASAAADQLLICEREGTALDDVLRANGVAACGFDQYSAFRPALQSVGLALELLWKPVDVHRVIEFLTHPYGPFRRKARWRLAVAYVEQPGFGGSAWEAAKSDIAKLNDGAELLAQVAYWFEGQHWTRDEGAPLEAVSARVERVARSLRVLMGAPRDDVLAVAGAIKQADALLAALEELKAQGTERLGPRHVEQLLGQATVAGASNPYAEPEVGCWRSTTRSASTALEPAEEVVWWMPSRPSLPAPYPWSAAEIHALGQSGVELRDPSLELRALAGDWLRPLLAAQKRFILVLPSSADEEHPIWQLVKRLLPLLPLRQIANEIATDERKVAVPDKPFPSVQRYLDIRSAMTSRRERQSYTSLSDLFDNPAVAVLKDAAALRGATLMAVQGERKLLGTLAHRLVENLFAENGVLGWDATKVRAWFDGHADSLIEAEGAPLLMLGFGVALHRFKATVREGAVALLGHLQVAGVVNVKTEVEFQGTLLGVPVIGKVDLLVELPSSRFAALDLKWSSEGRYQERLKSGTHLQLAIYSSLIEQNIGQAPVELGFFIFDSRALLVTTNEVFAQAKVCAPPADSTVNQLLSRAEGSWRWRNQQLADGVLEVVDTHLAELEDFQGPPGTLPVKETGPWNAQYLALLGWEEDS